MITGGSRFNIYLLTSLIVACTGGCQWGNDATRQKSMLSLHLEATPEALSFSKKVPVYRQQPVMVCVDTAPFLTETSVAGAKVVDVPGGFSLEIQFDRHGTWVLESYSTTNPGRHVAIYCEFGPKKPQEARWLAAPLLQKRIAKGILTFTPDATRAEADQIVLGLNNVAKKNKEDTRW
jgi:hypothetical protein